ncbi:uncharacterized protein LOC129748798 [Uranotaenia lowii]|uniref:uncharacterized protein LOC129748798 n=1 Tax=Uranotaenia lowii TaxID=190385 RepID=UPI00247ACDC7|nr:uncharacterized protein LOC129748798 [Uranotaenia lowii]
MKAFIVLAAVLAVASGNSLICRNYRSGALIPNPENCAEFFMCRPGRAIKFTCPQFTRFNPSLMACDPTSAVVCKPGHLPLDLEFTPINAGPSVIEHTNPICVDKNMRILLANPNTCNNFYQCSPTGAIAFSCPPGTLFDANRLYCERADLASCSAAILPEIPVMPELPTFPEVPIIPQLPEVPVVPEIPVMPEIPAIVDDTYVIMRCRGQREGARFRHPTDCRRYIVCSNMGRSQIFSCPANLAFNTALNACDWERNVKC